MQIKEVENVRADKFLWAVRLFKTRAIATEEINKGRVLINGSKIKPSRVIKKGDVVDIVKPPITFSYQVLLITDNRQPAKNIEFVLKDVTKSEELEKMELLKTGKTSIYREKGLGRPTKKERRILDDFIEDF
jgi:ribosome-associated heat shock protein Hsp15